MFWVDVLKRSSIAQAGAQCKSEGGLDHPGRRSSAVSYGRTYTLQATRGWTTLALDVWGLASMRKVHVHIPVALFGYNAMQCIDIFSVFSLTWKNLKSLKADQSCDLFYLSNYQQSYLGMVHLHRV